MKITGIENYHALPKKVENPHSDDTRSPLSSPPCAKPFLASLLCPYQPGMSQAYSTCFHLDLQEAAFRCPLLLATAHVSPQLLRHTPRSDTHHDMLKTLVSGLFFSQSQAASPQGQGLHGTGLWVGGQDPGH